MRRPDLVADCACCAAICCVATAFDASDDFAHDKPAGEACRYVKRDHRCAIHGELAVRGFAGCAAYDCYGAGPRAARAFTGHPGSEPARDELFRVLRPLHELLWLLTEAITLCPASHPGLAADLASEIATIDALAEATVTARAAAAAALADIDPSSTLASHEQRARTLLRRVGSALGGRRRGRRSLPIAPPNS